MVNSIHDLAIAYGKEHQGTVDIEVFEAGANAMLKEIINCFPDTFCINPNEVIDNIASRIRELKG